MYLKRFRKGAWSWLYEYYGTSMEVNGNNEDWVKEGSSRPAAHSAVETQQTQFLSKSSILQSAWHIFGKSYREKEFTEYISPGCLHTSGWFLAPVINGEVYFSNNTTFVFFFVCPLTLWSSCQHLIIRSWFILIECWKKNIFPLILRFWGWIKSLRPKWSKGRRGATTIVV